MSEATAAPPGMAEVLGVGPEFVFQGKTYRIHPRTFEHEALFQQKVKQWALEEIQRFERIMSPLQYKLQNDGWRHDCASRLYEFEMPICQMATVSEPGAKYLAYLALAQGDKTVTPQLVDEVWKDSAKWNELNEKMTGLNNPNRRSPATGSPAA
jgi:hypothetical protein